MRAEGTGTDSQDAEPSSADTAPAAPRRRRGAERLPGDPAPGRPGRRGAVSGWLGKAWRPRRSSPTSKANAASAAASAASPEPAPVAFVLSSGANFGAVQVGMLRALVEHGIRPDLIVGCSVGALNGAGFAEDPSPAGVARLEHVWRTTSGRDLMPRQWIPPAVAMARRGEAIHPRDGLEQLLHNTVTATTFEELKTPFHCVATDVMEGREQWFSSGPLVLPVLASAAMPAIFPSVDIDGRRYLDGAVVTDVPMRRAVELGARTLYVLEVGPLSRSWSEPKRPLDTAMEAYWICRRHRFHSELETLPADVEVHLMPHGDPPQLRFHDFDHSDQLMRHAYMAATAYLDERLALARPSSHAVAT
jgi:NTE family protein